MLSGGRWLDGRQSRARDIVITPRRVAAAYADAANSSAAHANRPTSGGHNKLALRHRSHTGSKARDAGTPLRHRVSGLIEHDGCTGLGDADIACGPAIRSHHTLEQHKMPSCINYGNADRTAQFFSALLTRVHNTTGDVDRYAHNPLLICNLLILLQV